MQLEDHPHLYPAVESCRTRGIVTPERTKARQVEAFARRPVTSKLGRNLFWRRFGRCESRRAVQERNRRAAGAAIWLQTIRKRPRSS